MFTQESGTLAHVGVTGLAVMGRNLARNLARHGYTVAIHNRSYARTESLVADHGDDGDFVPTESLADFVAALARPRKVIVMVKAGGPTDAVIDELVPLLDEGDIVVDAGNAHFPDTRRREAALAAKGLHFVGTGVSGGEEGALNGPSIMPGGSRASYEVLGPILEDISAKVDGVPCCTYVGPDGAGHFVKMVHNGIEYGDMQLICEVYQLMHEVLGMDYGAMQAAFADWNKGELGSYLIEITRDILGYKDADGGPLVEKILDKAGQKGTGKWTGIAALEFAVPLTLIGEAVFARCLSAVKDERVAASKVYSAPKKTFKGDAKAFVEDLKHALYASKIVSYAQGYLLMREAAKEYGWDLNYGGIALMWRGGCIIRSVFLGKIKEAFDKDPSLANLLMDPFFRDKIEKAQGAWRRVVAAAVENGIPVPALSSALAYFDAYRSERLPANLLQAQRDYFGAHTYERTDKPRGEWFHTNWTGRGGTTSASTYNA